MLGGWIWIQVVVASTVLPAEYLDGVYVRLWSTNVGFGLQIKMGDLWAKKNYKLINGAAHIAVSLQRPGYVVAGKRRCIFATHKS